MAAPEFESSEDFVSRVEQAHFRTDEDTGANPSVLMIWNMVRRHFGMSNLLRENLPAYCATHDTYHKIKPDYGCKRKEKK